MNIRFEGLADGAARWLQQMQLCDAAQWARFVQVYRTQPDAENQGWRGEYWGKMMRGGALVYAYTRDEALLRVLTDTIRDMMTAAEPDGRVSTYERDKEFDSWDLWSRKYVLLGSEYFYDVCPDEAFKKELLTFLQRCADYILAHIGPGKKDITEASRSWYGVNSASILEPMVRLYRLTGAQRYLDFASYIVQTGGAKGVNVFELAYENRLLPYQYGVSKAYELTSCFEGLLEYYFVTGEEKYRRAVINYAHAVRNSEVSIIGSCGVTHELFDHTRTRQTVRYDGVMQETCVTVTWMKFCARLLELTGESVWADEMERSFYNAYLGAINRNQRVSENMIRDREKLNITPTLMPFDSYSPLTPGRRGRLVGGWQMLEDRSYYGCCACIGAAGAGVFLRSAVTVQEDGVTVNFFEKGTAEVTVQGVPVRLTMDTRYPSDGFIRLVVEAASPVTFTLKVRTPAWAQGPGGYMHYTRQWTKDELTWTLDMPVRLHRPEHWETDTVCIDMTRPVPGYEHAALPVEVTHQPEEDCYVAVTRGPLTLAADSRLGKAADSAFAPTYNAQLTNGDIAPGAPCLVRMTFTPENGEAYDLVDYASAGQDWDTLIAAWIPTARG